MLRGSSRGAVYHDYFGCESAYFPLLDKEVGFVVSRGSRRLVQRDADWWFGEFGGG
jgi:hypothetical protein